MPKMSIEPVRHVLSGPTMGTRWSATIYAPAAFDARPVTEALAAEVGRVDDQMSTWKSESDLMRLNAAAPGRWVDIP
ncbi:thiamine biosynthesis protein ApbE, partial [Cereibacter changlensis JA139]